MIYLLTASNFEDAKTFVPPRISGIFTRKQVACIEGAREHKKNTCDISRVYEIPDSLLNNCYYEVIKEATIVFDTSKKLRKKKKAKAKVLVPDLAT